MNFDIKATLAAMLNAVHGVVAADFPKVRACVQRALNEEREFLSELAKARIDGEILSLIHIWRRALLRLEAVDWLAHREREAHGYREPDIRYYWRRLARRFCDGRQGEHGCDLA